MQKRRSFLKLSALTALAMQTPFLFTGCGGGGGGSGGGSSASATGLDAQLAAISAQQATNNTLHQQSSNSSATTVGATQPYPSQTSVALASVSSTVTYTPTLFTAFAANALKLNTNPLNQTSGPITTTYPLTNDLYLPQASVWSDYVSANKTAYDKATAQLNNLKMALSKYGEKTGVVAQSSTVVAQTSLTLTSVDTSSLTSAIGVIKALNLSTVSSVTFSLAVDGLILAINLVVGLINTLMTSNSVSGNAAAVVAFNAIEGILKWIESNSVNALNNVNLSTSGGIVAGIAKISVVALSALSIANLQKIQNTTSVQTALTGVTATEQQILAFLAANQVQSQLILTLSTWVQNIMTNNVNSVSTLVSNVNGDPSYTLTTADTALIASLKQQSTVLSVLGLVMQALVYMYSSGASTTNTTTLGSDVTANSALFVSPVNTNNTSFTSFISSMLATAPSGTGTTSTNSVITALLATLTNSSTPLPTGVTSTPAGFATNMAAMAYDFTMKMENDAYNFATLGMTYGYLFASQGESVGLMADRILFMSVQIGQMADRIGEMADRIVYTEQLIVYTEMLIQNFGLMMYGGMGTISNTMLTGLAIIFDRQWYTPTSTANDPIVASITATTSQMLTNMQQYEMAVLANQNTLRQTTLGALNWIQGAY